MSRRLRVTLLCALACAAPAVAHAQTAAPSPPPAEITRLTDAVMTASNADNAAGFAGLYTDDAVVVDENAPFAWHGAGAGTAWWTLTHGIIQKLQLVSFKAAPQPPSEFTQSDTDAYMIVPITLTGTAAHKPFAETGTMTYTFHKTPTGWKISTQIWTTKP